MPQIVEILALNDKKLSLTKEGVFITNGVKCPRATLNMEWDSSHTAIEMLGKIVKILDELESNNQIVSYSIR
jgi:hypothetical protein